MNMEKEEFVNPIDKDKITDRPNLLPYAHSLGSAIIKPLDKGRIKGLAMSAMYEQTGTSLERIREQIELLVEQAQDIHHRMDVSEKIYNAEYNFKPNIGQTYHLYQRENGNWVLSLVGPKEWGKSCPYKFVQTVKLLSDHTWEIII